MYMSIVKNYGYAIAAYAQLLIIEQHEVAICYRYMHIRTMITKKELGRRLQLERELRNLSRNDLANRMGVRASTVFRWERGGDMLVQTLLTACYAMHMDPRRIFMDKIYGFPESTKTF